MAFLQRLLNYPNKVCRDVTTTTTKDRERGKNPDAWKTGYLGKLLKKGDVSQCGNWREIMRLSNASKVPTKVILERMKEALNKELRSEQAEFR